MKDIVNELVEAIGLPKEMIIKATNFMGELLSDPLKELSNIAYDQVRLLRVKNQVRLLINAKQYFIKKGLEPTKVPAKNLVPLLEGVSLEEDETMHQKWTALLINESDPSIDKKIRPAYIDILKQLLPKEAKILDILYNSYKNGSFVLRHARKRIKAEVEINDNDILISIDNFIRLNIWTSTLTEELFDNLNREAHGEKDRIWYMLTEKTTYKFTSLGEDFIRCCRIEC